MNQERPRLPIRGGLYSTRNIHRLCSSFPLHRRAAAREEIVPGRQPRRSAFADKMIVHYFSLSYFFGLLLLSVGVILPLAYMVVKSKKLSLGTRRD